MATHLLGTNANNSLVALQYSGNMADADVAAIDQLIADDQSLAPWQLGPGATQRYGGLILSGTTTNGTKTITSVTVTLPAGGLLSGLIGSYVYGNQIGIAAGARVVSVSGTTLTLSGASGAAAGAGTFFAVPRHLGGSFSKNGQLYVPNRGSLTLLPGDYVGVGAAGEVVLVPKQAVAYSASVWTFT